MNWHALATVASVDPSAAELRSATGELRGLPLDDVVDGIVRWRVDELALANLRSVGVGELANRLQDMWITEERRLAKAIPVTVELLPAVRAMGGRVIKGLAVRDKYPRPELRHMGDVDVQVPDWPTALRICRWLRERRWCWETSEYPWLKWDEHGQIYGQLTFVLPDNIEPFARVDLHIGPFSVGHSGLLPLVGWRPGLALDAEVTVPDIETSVALVVAHAVGDGLLSMKDVNDLYVLLTKARPDWTSVVELCRAAGVTEALHVLLAACREVYPTLGLPWTLTNGRRPLRDGTTGGPLSLTEESRERRAGRVARLAFRDERARGQGVLRSFGQALSARRYYRADLTPRTVQSGADGSTPGTPGRGRCWRLLPQETWTGLPTPSGPGGDASAEPREIELAAGLTLVTRHQAMAVAIDKDVMLPTVWGTVHPESVELARELVLP